VGSAASSYRGQMRLDGVEIKANIAQDDVSGAMDALELEDDNRLLIWFYEDTSPGLSLPLLEAGLAIRVRAKTGDNEGDCTVKLRPCRRSQATPFWLSTTETGEVEVRLEEDWSGDRRVLAMSCETELDAGGLAAVQASGQAPEDLLGELQERFLAECGPLRVNVPELTRLGPIEATKWKKVRADELGDLEARAERWRVAGLDFLEVSVKVDPGDAVRVRGELLDALQSLDIPLDASQESKTKRALLELLP
jgi:hypothetical protein